MKVTELEPGDLVKVNGKRFWVCRCAEGRDPDSIPLNRAFSRSCCYCSMPRPPLSWDVELRVAAGKKAGTYEFTLPKRVRVLGRKFRITQLPTPTSSEQTVSRPEQVVPESGCPDWLEAGIARIRRLAMEPMPPNWRNGINEALAIIEEERSKSMQNGAAKDSGNGENPQPSEPVAEAEDWQWALAVIRDYEYAIGFRAGANAEVSGEEPPSRMPSIGDYRRALEILRVNAKPEPEAEQVARESGEPRFNGEYHFLKTWPKPFAAIRSGEKTFEYRVGDRNFQKGDILWLAEFDPRTRTLTGEIESREVTYILSGPDFGIPEGYVIMAITPVKREAAHSETVASADVLEDGAVKLEGETSTVLPFEREPGWLYIITPEDKEKYGPKQEGDEVYEHGEWLALILYGKGFPFLHGAFYRRPLPQETTSQGPREEKS